MKKDSRILVTGGETLIGAAIVGSLREEGYGGVIGGSGAEPDCADLPAVELLFSSEKPEYVFHAAGKTAGIAGNQRHPADLMYDNLLGAVHVIHAAFVHGTSKLLYLASSCSYPKQCPQPMKEEYLLTGPLEPTNEAYAVAKIAGIKLCQAYRQQHGANFVAGIPANAFGPGDDFSPEDSHVVAALLRRFHEAKVNRKEVVEIWGTGSPRREFIFTRDLADACIFVMNAYEGEHPINLGNGSDMSIGELARAVKAVSGFPGRIGFDTSKPDGMPVKVLDSGRLRELGWRPKTRFSDALRETYDWYVEHRC